jgi:methyltransferase-like protein
MTPPPTTPYDRIPYPSSPFPQTHPDRLTTIAALHGMQPAPPAVDTARVLEIGCALADNLIPLALQHPHARFVGIDASAGQIAAAQAAAQEMAVTNLELLHMDLMEFPSTMGTFDFIICHGVYSWVPDAVQDGIFALIRRHLAPNGVGYVSYNTLPGWRLLGALRDILLYDTRAIDDPDAKLQRARDTVELLLNAVPEGEPLRGIVKGVSRVFMSPEYRSYVLHEYFEATNQPVYFHEFVARAAAHGLQFLSEASIEDTQTHRLPPAAQTALKALDAQPIEREQYLDFIRCRPFRQTLLCHADVEIDRVLRPARLESLHLASNAKASAPVTDLSTRDFMTFEAENGAELRTNAPLTKAAMVVLRESWPRTIPCAALETAARARAVPTPVTMHDAADFQRDRDEWLESFLQLVLTGVIETHTVPASVTTEVSERPVASPWARRQAAHGRPVSNLRHRLVATDDVQRHLILLLDGTRTLDQVLDGLIAFAESKRLVVVHEGKALHDRDQIRRTLATLLPQELTGLARNGLLLA